MANTLKACTALIGFAALTGAAFADGLAAQRLNIEDFARVEQTAPQVQTALAPDACSVLCWDNGPYDQVTAHLAQQTDIGFFQAADDFMVKAGYYKYVDTVTVCFLISSNIDGIMFKPQMGLNIYDDCGGRPNSVVYSVTDPLKIQAVNMGPSFIAGFNLWSITFEVKQFLTGYGRWYISPYGIAAYQDAMYFWASANLGQIQGVQGQLKNGSDPWMDVTVCDCPGICTDFCFTINGHLCCLAKNNVPYDPTGGASSLQLKGAIIDTSRAVDNFQIGPYKDVDVCRVEAWVATNCPLDKFFFEIYANDCNMPGTKLFTYDVDGFPLAEAETGVFYNGVQVYHLIWPEICPEIVLSPGRDYWLSIVGRGNGSILDKAYWMYLQLGSCNINITEGKVKDPYVPGLEDFTFVSEATSGPPRDFAFKLWTHELGSKSDNGNDGGSTGPSSGGATQPSLPSVHSTPIFAPVGSAN
jgi:hypothetical protein